MELRQLADPIELEAALASGPFLLFKHSRICPISARAFEEYRAYLEEHPGVTTGWIDVVGQRPLSQSIAASSGVQHESPQALLFLNGEVEWHASHGGITRDSLTAALGQGASGRKT
jgi:bacillithiol system protein YtxJ